MKKITIDEYDSLELKVPGWRRKENPLYREFDALGINEAILLKRADWVLNTSPGAALNIWFEKQNKRFSARSLADNSGWAILRIK